MGGNEERFFPTPFFLVIPRGVHPHTHTRFPYLLFLRPDLAVIPGLRMDWRKQRSGSVDEHRGPSELRRGQRGSGDRFPLAGQRANYLW